MKDTKDVIRAIVESLAETDGVVQIVVGSRETGEVVGRARVEGDISKSEFEQIVLDCDAIDTSVASDPIEFWSPRMSGGVMTEFRCGQQLPSPTTEYSGFTASGDVLVKERRPDPR